MVKKATQSKTKKPVETSNFQPTKVGLMVAATAAISLVVVAMIAVYS